MANDRPSTRDENDDLFDYDIDLNDPFRDDYEPPAPRVREKEKAKKALDAAAKNSGLGLDEEVEVLRKPRAPRVKLDENLLLSPAGIPKLRSKAKALKFKGKGHEFSDASRLLSFYQIWLDDLFPKAKFLDAVAMVEKQGHRKRIQAMRMEWIKGHQESMDADESNAGVVQTSTNGAGEKLKTPETCVHVEDDLYNATPRPTNVPVSRTSWRLTSPLAIENRDPAAGPDQADQNDPFEDELDELLAAGVNSQLKTPLGLNSMSKATENEFDDDEQALAEMEMDW